MDEPRFEVWTESDGFVVFDRRCRLYVAGRRFESRTEAESFAAECEMQSIPFIGMEEAMTEIGLPLWFASEIADFCGVQAGEPWAISRFDVELCRLRSSGTAPGVCPFCSTEMKEVDQIRICERCLFQMPVYVLACMGSACP